MREMKESGIEWIGEIPEDWEVRKIASVYKERTEKVSDKDYEPLSVTKKGVVPQLENAAKTTNGDNRKLVKKGDFAINSRSDRRGSCGISPLDGSVSLIMTVLKPRNNMDNKYYNYVFRSERFSDEFYKWGHGIVDDLWSTKWEDMKRIFIPFPNKEEQELIADYLDEKVQEIDNIISKTQKTIEEYKKYKQSVITEAVTKGLNLNVEMKDSGIEWIGEIPKHWNIGKIKNFYKVICGSTPKSQILSYWDGDIVWITPSDYKTDDIFINSSKRKITEEGIQSCGTTLVPKGSIVVSNRAPIGSVAIANIELCTNQGCKSLVNKCNSINNKLMYYYISIMENVLNVLGRGTTFLELSTPDLSNFNCIFMNKEEQEYIVKYLDKKCNEIDNLITKKQELIAQLETYKKSLIYECVTGKKEVALSYAY